MRIFIFSSIICFQFLVKAQLLISDVDLNIGSIEEAYQIKTIVTLTNTSNKVLFLMRADVEKEVTVQSISKRLAPNDTTSLFLTYTPKKDGRFKTIISLVTSDRGEPYTISWSGQLKKWKNEDRTACYYFKKPGKGVVVKETPMIVPISNEPKDVSNKIPDLTQNENGKQNEKRNENEEKKQGVETPNDELSLILYKPNNIVFLVDVSSSMKDSLKLPLMKLSLYKLVEALRDVDKVSFVTYADSVKIINENIKGSDKQALKSSIAAIKAKGLTKGNKAILASLDLTLKHYLPEGNNQIILATDGEFRIVETDYKNLDAKVGTKSIVVSTVGFGKDKVAIKKLKDIAKRGNGSFIHITSLKTSESLLLEEIKSRSKR
jgi:hypothetical protein